MKTTSTILRIANKHYFKTKDPGIHRFKVLAIITDKKGNIISRAMNSYDKTHPIQKQYAYKLNKPTKIFLHAEIAALIKCKKKPHTIYVSRFFKNGDTALAKPCKVCELALKEAGIKHVIYTIKNGTKKYSFTK